MSFLALQRGPPLCPYQWAHLLNGIHIYNCTVLPTLPQASLYLLPSPSIWLPPV